MNAIIPQYSAPCRGWIQKTAGVAILMAASCLCAQDLPYSSGSTGADGALDVPAPISARYNHAAAFHEGVGKLMVFGGDSNSGSFNDTAVRNTPHWASSTPVGSPPVRNAHAMVYDAARQEIVLFGGTNAFLNDTWVWNGTIWSQKSPTTSPPGRNGHAMVYDSARQKVVLFGGFGSGAYLNDTWEWDGTNWAVFIPAIKPSARSNHAMAYDENRQRTVLFGGFTGGALGDIWEWDGSAWLEKIMSPKPTPRGGSRMTYDRARQEIILFGGSYTNGPIYYLSDTWTYVGNGWEQKFPAHGPDATVNFAMAYDPLLQKTVMVAGYNPGPKSSTWLWNGSDWSKESDTSYTFDMASRNDGVWNFTTINVPGGVTVFFKKNLTNKPVQWLASGNVTISGAVSLDGEAGRAATNVESGNEAMGGPGGYNGGLGGRRFSISGSYLGSAGGGPGGGAPGIQNQAGGNGTYTGVYGNTFIQPLIGGSGGGGGSSADLYNGGNGGGGGGALLIASSGDIRVDGGIFARGGSGGQGESNVGRSGGIGSGGAIRLIADRVIGGGTLLATGSGTSGGGRIRVEGYYRPLAAAGVVPTPSAGPPTETFAGLGVGLELTIASVKGTNVRQPPLGDTSNPDVIFTEAGVVTIIVAGTNIPNGTPVTLRLATSAGVQVLPASGSPAITMTGNSASFTATVPAGVGTLQAYATVDATATP